MKAFDKWYMDNHKKQSDLQFTKLTPDDMVIHESLYTELLATYSSAEVKQQSGVLPAAIYYDYAAEELQKAKQLFCKTFK